MPSFAASRRRLGWAFTTIALVASLAGCVSMQDSGPPGSLPASPSNTTQDAANIGPIPVSPVPGLKPQQIVEAFLQVSASYSTYPNIVKSYLTPQQAKVWNPQWSATVFSSDPSVTLQPTPKGRPAPKQETVTVQGPVEATFSGSGQYLSVAQGSTQNSCSGEEQNYTSEKFSLTQSDGQWRIATLPSCLLLGQTDFFRVYQPQDLYFFDPAFKVLVPDTVFVPLGTPAAQLLSTLVSTLIPPSAGGSAATSQTWLTAGATVTSFPAGTKLLAPVTISDGTATVNLGGTIAQPSEQKSIAQVEAQLTWTLIGSPTGSPGPLYSAITAVNLVIGGHSWLLTSQTPGYAPYPSQPGVFTYVDHNVAQSICGSSPANAGASVPVFGANGEPTLATCGSTGASPSPSPSPSSTSSAGQRTSGKHPPSTAPANPVAMIAAAPAHDYLAGVSAGLNQVTIWSLSAHGGTPVKWDPPGQTIYSISWDRQDNLWVVTHDDSSQNNSIYVVSAATGKATLATFGVQGNGQGNVLSLSVAPDGVRVALIVQNNPGTQRVELAAIEREACQSGAGCRYPGSVDVTLAQGPPLGGSSITEPTSVAWQDEDTLYVLDNSQPTSDLWKVPVSGRPATGPDPVLMSSGSSAYAESIAADTGNVLVAGMSNGQLLISSGFGEGWQVLGPGSAPAYGINP